MYPASVRFRWGVKKRGGRYKDYSIVTALFDIKYILKRLVLKDKT